MSRWERMEPGSLGQGNRMRFSKRGQEKGCVSLGENGTRLTRTRKEDEVQQKRTRERMCLVGERMEPGSLGQGNRMRFSKRGQEKGCVSLGENGTRLTRTRK